MPEFKKREIAYKLKIGGIIKGNPVIDYEQSKEGETTKERFKFLEIGDKKIQRVNVIANIIDKYVSEGERKFGTLTIDDASGQIRIKAFGDDTTKFQNLNQGETILIIGFLRSYNNEVYVLPEIIKRIDTRYLLIRKLELEKENPAIIMQNKEGKIEIEESLKEKVINLIREEENKGGIDTEEIILKLKDINPEKINQEIIKLIEQGTVYEPRPGRVRYLG